MNNSNKTKALFIGLGLILGTGMSFASATFASSHSDTETRGGDSTSTTSVIEDNIKTDATGSVILDDNGDDTVKVRSATSVIGSQSGDTHEQNDRNRSADDDGDDEGFDD